MAAAHLGTLPLTQQILLARQRAFTAKERILTDSPPISVQHFHLYDQRSGDELLPDISSVDLHCGDTAFSPCGSYLAVWLGAMQESRHSCHLVPIHAVVLCNISVGFQTVVRFCTGRLEPDLVWSSSGQLCVAQILEISPQNCSCSVPKIGQPIEDSAVFIKDPKAAAVVCSPGSKASGLLLSLGQGHRTNTVWAPCGRCLLVLLGGLKSRQQVVVSNGDQAYVSAYLMTML